MVWKEFIPLWCEQIIFFNGFNFFEIVVEKTTGSSCEKIVRRFQLCVNTNVMLFFVFVLVEPLTQRKGRTHTYFFFVCPSRCTGICGSQSFIVQSRCSLHCLTARWLTDIGCRITIFYSLMTRKSAHESYFFYFVFCFMTCYCFDNLSYCQDRKML